MRLHFSIDCYDNRRTTRLLQSIQFSGIQILFADHVRRRSGVDNKFSFLRFKIWWRRQAHIFRKWEECCFYLCPLICGYFWPDSTLLHGHVALAIPSLPEIDPQILEHWGYADEDHLGKSLQAMDFGLECQFDVQRLWWILHIGLVSVCLSSSAKSMKTSAAPYPETRNPIVVYLMSKRQKQVSLFFDAAHAFST